MKRLAFALVGVLLAVALTGATTPIRVLKMVEVRSLSMIDENGLRVGIGSGGIIYRNESGKIRARFGENGIAYYDENGAERARMDADGFAYFDEKGDGIIPRVLVGANGFTHYGENGYLDSRLGALELTDKETGQESRYPAGVALFDDDGNVIWMAPD